MHSVKVEHDTDGNVAAALSIYRDDAADRDVAILARPGYLPRGLQARQHYLMPRKMRSLG